MNIGKSYSRFMACIVTALKGGTALWASPQGNVVIIGEKEFNKIQNDNLFTLFSNYFEVNKWDKATSGFDNPLEFYIHETGKRDATVISLTGRVEELEKKLNDTEKALAYYQAGKIQKIEELEKEVERLEQSEKSLIESRDKNEDIISKIAINLGCMEEWSNHHSHWQCSVEKSIILKHQLVINALEDIKLTIEIDEATVVKNFPKAATGYVRCKMLIDEKIEKIKKEQSL
jgi:hypothetical protein